MKAIFETGGKQYYVAEGDEIFVEKLDIEPSKTIDFDTVLCVGEKTGTPYVKGAKVTCEVIKQGKQKKITILKYHNKNNRHRTTKGHRQPYTKLKVTKIVG